MTQRWIVDTDGRGQVAVAEDASGRPRIVKAGISRDKAERLMARLRERDAERAQRAKVEAGHRLAASNQRRRQTPQVGEASELVSRGY
jgi:hypothetical protein